MDKQAAHTFHLLFLSMLPASSLLRIRHVEHEHVHTATQALRKIMNSCLKFGILDSLQSYYCFKLIELFFEKFKKSLMGKMNFGKRF